MAMTQMQKQNHVNRLLQQCNNLRMTLLQLGELVAESEGVDGIDAKELPPALGWLAGKGYTDAIAAVKDVLAAMDRPGPGEKGVSLRTRLRQLQA